MTYKSEFLAEQIRTAHDVGFTVKEISNWFRISRGALTKIADRNGFSLSTKNLPVKDRHHAWAGNDIGYRAAHERVERERGTPDRCEKCGEMGPEKRYEWASLSKNYSDVNDYIRLCVPCHRVMDGLPRGVRHPNAKLTDEQVVEIRTSQASSRFLAKRFGVSSTTICNVKNRKIWTHI